MNSNYSRRRTQVSYRSSSSWPSSSLRYRRAPRRTGAERCGEALAAAAARSKGGRARRTTRAGHRGLRRPLQGGSRRAAARPLWAPPRLRLQRRLRRPRAPPGPPRLPGSLAARRGSGEGGRADESKWGSFNRPALTAVGGSRRPARRRRAGPPAWRLRPVMNSASISPASSASESP